MKAQITQPQTTDERMESELNFVSNVVRNRKFDLGFRTGFVTAHTDSVKLFEALEEITAMALRWSQKGLTPTIFKAQKAIENYKTKNQKS